MPWKPISQTFVLFTGAPSPLVTAAADNSSPMLIQEKSRGTRRYSIILVTLPLPKAIPLMRIASRIARYSSDNVGKNRIITAIEIVSPWGKCIRFIAAINSLIFVVEMQYQTIIIVGANCVIIKHRNKISIPATPPMLSCATSVSHVAKIKRTVNRAPIWGFPSRQTSITGI